MTHTSNGEVFGSRLLNTVLILGSVAILVASLIGPSLKTAPAQFGERAAVTAQQS